MLVLTCRIGDTVRIGDDLCMTVQSRFRDRVTVGVVAPAGVGSVLRERLSAAFSAAGRAWSYLFPMLAVRRYRVGDVEVCVWLPGDAVSMAADCDELLHVGVIAPTALRVPREQDTTGIQPTDAQSRAMSAVLLLFFSAPLFWDEAITPC